MAEIGTLYPFHELFEPKCLELFISSLSSRRSTNVVSMMKCGGGMVVDYGTGKSNNMVLL